MTGIESPVTSLHCDPENIHLLLAGFGDGTVRLFDSRVTSSSPSQRVMTFREHKNCWVGRVRMRAGGAKVYSGDASGQVKIWSVNRPESFTTLQTLPTASALDFHAHADVIAAGSPQQMVTVLTDDGTSLGTVKYHDGFRGQRIGPISCLAFHPYKVSSLMFSFSLLKII